MICLYLKRKLERSTFQLRNCGGCNLWPCVSRLHKVNIVSSYSEGHPISAKSSGFVVRVPSGSDTGPASGNLLVLFERCPRVKGPVHNVLNIVIPRDTSTGVRCVVWARGIHTLLWHERHDSDPILALKFYVCDRQKYMGDRGH